MPESAPREDASLPDPVVKPAANRWAKVGGHLKRFRGPIAAIAAFGAILSGLLGYLSAYQTVEKVIAPSPRGTVAPALSLAILPFASPSGSTAVQQFAESLTQDLT